MPDPWRAGQLRGIKQAICRSDGCIICGDPECGENLNESRPAENLQYEENKKPFDFEARAN
jgi:hypothetical protein